MKYTELNLEMLTLVGIKIRTTNREAKAQKDIAQLWSDFFVYNIKDKIQNKLSEDIYCVYSDYENDFMGEYTTYIACEVSDITDLPSELVSITIPRGKYFEFISEGKLPECVGKTWNHIWSSEYDRAYLADFDVYGREASDTEKTKVKTFLSIK